MKKKIKSYEDYIKEDWNPHTKEWEKTKDGKTDYSSKSASYYHKDEVVFLWDYWEKDLEIIPNNNIENLKPLKISNVVDKEMANGIISILVDHPYDMWEEILNDNEVIYQEIQE